MICHDKKVLVITPSEERFEIELREGERVLYECTVDALKMDLEPRDNYRVREYRGASGHPAGRRLPFAKRFLVEPPRSSSES